MTLATTEVHEFTFADLADSFGYRVVPLTSKRGSALHYVTRDEKDRTVIGPVRHKRRKTAAKKAVRYERFASNEELTQHLRATQDNQERALLKGMQTTNLSEMMKKMVQADKPKATGFMAKARNWVSEHFWDETFHKRCQQLLLTVLLAVLVTGCTIIIGKAVVWTLVH